MSKLKAEDYRDIHLKWISGERVITLSEKYGVSGDTIIRIAKSYGIENNLSIRRERPPLPCRNDITGKKFGHLEVIKMIHSGVKRTSWKALCKCHLCGNETFSCCPKYLRQRMNQTCGCSTWERKKGKDSPFFKGFQGITGSFWHQIEKGAKTRGFEFKVSIQHAWSLFQQQSGKCKLSGIELSIGQSNYDERTASFDRIDSSVGYIEGNVQWVHKDINKMKLHHSEKYFVELCQKVASHAASKTTN
jgi:hypothetical protein